MLPKPETGEKNGNFNFEAFSLQKVGETTIAVWAERGNGKRLGQLFWSKFDANFPPAKATPLPIGFTYVSDNEPLRHVSDLKVDTSGALFVSAAADGDNNGLFNSYFYQAGQFAINGDQVNFSKAVAPTILYRFPNHKVEAFDMMTGPRGGVIFGTDDEPWGGYIGFGGQ